MKNFSSSINPENSSCVVCRVSCVYRDITNETKDTYRLDKPGTFVFFAKNRTGEITFSVEHSGARVFAFFVFEGKEENSYTLTTHQRHLVPKATSHILVKSVLRDRAQFHFVGNIFIEKGAIGTETSLENRNLLISKKASASSEPRLEILEGDVQCRHASTTAPINGEHLAYLTSRGISQKDAETLLIEGFLKEVEEKIQYLSP